MELVAFLALLAATAWWVSRPFARAPGARAEDRAALELEHELRLAAVRDAELDAQVGKLSAERYRELDAELREEALATLRRLREAP